MKKLFIWLLLAASVFGLCGCGFASSPPETTEAKAETVAPEAQTGAGETAETQAAETEPPVLEGNLFLKVSSITFSLVGESEDIYLGLIPRELVTWESEDPSVVSVEDGVLTAKGVGTTTIRAAYYDRQVECTAGCLAATQEELDSLGNEILSSPKRLPPEVNLEEPCTYFDNSVIMGDSIAYFLWQEESQHNYLGEMAFVTRQGISINGLVRRFKNMYFQGKEMHIEDIAAKSESERIYLMLGCLDFQVPAALHYLMDNWNTMLDRIAEKCPDKQIVIVSNIPCFTEKIGPTDFNSAVADTNVQLRQLAEDRGLGFLDLGYYIQDHCGRMPAVYAKDDYHMNSEGSLVWMKILRYYAQYELESSSLS